MECCRHDKSRFLYGQKPSIAINYYVTLITQKNFFDPVIDIKYNVHPYGKFVLLASTGALTDELRRFLAFLNTCKMV